MQVGLRLPQVEMAPPPLLTVVPDIATLAACRARQLLVSMCNEYMRLLGDDINVNLANVPGFLEAEKGHVNLGVAHVA